MAAFYFYLSLLCSISPSIYMVDISHSVSFCWHGDIESHGTLMNESCATGKISTPNVISKLTLNNTEHSHPDNITVATSRAKNCMVFKYIVHREFGTLDKTYERSVYANYSCDYNDLCGKLSQGWHQDVLYKSLRGDVFCCSSNNCNFHIGVIPPQQRLCYNATNATETHTKNTVSCTVNGAMCARSTWEEDGKTVSRYFCDEATHCKTNGLKNRYKSCRKVRKVSGDGSEELCCCPGSKCLVPPWTIEDSPQLGVAAQRSTANWIIGGSIITLTFCVGVIVGVLLVAIHRRRKLQRSSHVAMIYRRVSANESTGKDDEQLIT